MILAFIAMGLTTVTLTSCGDDDDSTSGSYYSVISGTTWVGYYNTQDEGKVTLTYKFLADFKYQLTMKTEKGSTNNAEGKFSIASDNQTVYIYADGGTFTGKISDDGKTMTLTHSSFGSITFTKQ